MVMMYSNKGWKGTGLVWDNALRINPNGGKKLGKETMKKIPISHWQLQARHSCTFI